MAADEAIPQPVPEPDPEPVPNPPWPNEARSVVRHSHEEERSCVTASTILETAVTR